MTYIHALKQAHTEVQLLERENLDIFQRLKKIEKELAKLIRNSEKKTV